MSQRRPLPYTPHRVAAGEERPVGADYTRQPAPRGAGQAAAPLRGGLPTPHKAWNHQAEFEHELQAIQAGGGAAAAALVEQDEAQDRSPVIVRSPRRSHGGPTIMGEMSAGPIGVPSTGAAEPQFGLGQALPQVGSVLVCLQRARVRSACGLLSEEVGYTEVGESLVVQQAVLNEYDQIRICFERGWTSVSAGDGTPLLGSPDSAPAYAQPGAGGAAPTRIHPGDTCRVLARCIFRADCEMDSEELGVLDPGDMIFVEELGWTSQGKQRVRFERGWTSTEGVIGPLLMVVSDETSSPAAAVPPRVFMNGHTSPASPVDSPTGGGSIYSCVKKCVIRAAFDLNSDFFGHLQLDELVVAQETRVNSWGQVRVRFERGWVSIKAGDGGLLLAEKSIGDELGQKLNQISTISRQPVGDLSAAGGGQYQLHPSGGYSSEEYTNVHFDDGEGEDSPTAAAPP